MGYPASEIAKHGVCLHSSQNFENFRQRSVIFFIQNKVSKHKSAGSRGPNFFAKPWVSTQRSGPAAQESWSMMPSTRQRRLPRCSQDWGSSPRAHPQSGSRRANLIMSLMSKCWCSMCRSGRSVKQLMSVNDKSLFMGLQWSRVQGG